MSVNFNRARFKMAKSSKEFKLKMFKYHYNYCFICSKRAGCFYYNCRLHVQNRHGSGKPIENHDYREYKTWKYNRKTQFKQF